MLDGPGGSTDNPRSPPKISRFLYGFKAENVQKSKLVTCGRVRFTRTRFGFFLNRGKTSRSSATHQLEAPHRNPGKTCLVATKLWLPKISKCLSGCGLSLLLSGLCTSANFVHQTQAQPASRLSLRFVFKIRLPQWAAWNFREGQTVINRNVAGAIKNGRLHAYTYTELPARSTS